MSKIIEATKARSFTSDSIKRKKDIVDIMNINIQRAAKEGLQVASFPSGLTDQEQNFLRDECVLAGYTVEAHLIKW